MSDFIHNQAWILAVAVVSTETPFVQSDLIKQKGSDDTEREKQEMAVPARGHTSSERIIAIKQKKCFIF